MTIFPKEINDDYKGRKIALYFFYLLTAFTLVRSCIHIFLPDGGAQTIATIPLDSYTDAGEKTVILLFALWGLSQLLMGLFYTLVAWRYKSLIPLMYLFIFMEYLVRLGLILMNPIETTGTPPGGIFNLVILPLTMLLFFLSVNHPKKTRP